MIRSLLPSLLIFAIGISAAAEDPIAEVPGHLVIVGGGSLPAEVSARFVELAGGRTANLIVIPTASESADDPKRLPGLLAPWLALEPGTVAVLHTRDRDEANSPEFVKTLREATGVWFEGGDQTKLTAAYHDTAVQAELHALLERGGVIGGTSAGAAIMSELMIESGNPEANTGPGLGFLPGFVVDQHFLARNRVNRSLRVLEANPGHVGLGIDESTAVVVSGRKLEVMGESFVLVCLAPGNRRGTSIEVLRRGDEADLFQLRRAARARSQPDFPPDEPSEPVVESGSLVIGGGGGMPGAIWERFIELAGGEDAPIVVIPTAMGEPIPEEPTESRILKRLGAKDIRIFHTWDRDEANDPEFVKVFDEAGGVWFSGGRQWRFVDAYEGTLAEEKFHEVLKRGGVIGGSSAGASIQSEYMPRGHPLGNLEMMAEGYEQGFGFLPGVAVDQHFFARKRTGDMTALMKRYPQVLGIGLDEGSAIIVQGSVAEVVGRGDVAVYDREKPIPDNGPDYEVLKPGDRYDLRERELITMP